MTEQWPTMEFGAGVRVTEADGSEHFARYLAGPRMHEGQLVYWACDWLEYVNAIEREGRDPYGTAYPCDRVRPTDTGPP